MSRGNDEVQSCTRDENRQPMSLREIPTVRTLRASVRIGERTLTETMPREMTTRASLSAWNFGT